MLKKSGVILLCLLALTGCSVKKAEKGISSFLSKEYGKAQKICLAEHSEDECMPVEFTVSYNKKEDTLILSTFFYRFSYFIF